MKKTELINQKAMETMKLSNEIKYLTLCIICGPLCNKKKLTQLIPIYRESTTEKKIKKSTVWLKQF